jgi:hypothetical protein
MRPIKTVSLHPDWRALMANDLDGAVVMLSRADLRLMLAVVRAAEYEREALGDDAVEYMPYLMKALDRFNAPSKKK